MEPTPTSPRAAMAGPKELAYSGLAPSSSRQRPTDGPLVATDADPDAVLERIRTHLREGGFRTAAKLAKEAAGRFPDHPGIRTINRGLNEWNVRTRPADGHTRTEEFAWLRNAPESARGKLVALVGSEMIAAADTMPELMASLKSMKTARIPLIHRIDW